MTRNEYTFRLAYNDDLNHWSFHTPGSQIQHKMTHLSQHLNTHDETPGRVHQLVELDTLHQKFQLLLYGYVILIPIIQRMGTHIHVRAKIN